ncbi:hypothetical protein P153DRAFT_195481 [Dothidotthia symphoricarpi CBS 119687]|uniref:Uncharacterized protein n=1 Tax=Dothidotthia symphoricarpi CBS 119687 TaxID=1392245 RepID=A0A6A6AK14_9PLEO|nr:uncharacterized protein P153DRAFT_195481 [Dothidotthia symphoricarpi CBS 119687]KAF2131435.1 hypothetical protein P153DRAFT_195481 [Dothidotthia symphoricarpi CBS 119687]
MKTVPTLCATATVVGASAVGLGIGRTPLDVSHTNSNPNKKKAAPARHSGFRSMPTAVQTLTTTTTDTTTAPSFGAPISVAPSSRMSVATRHSQDGRPQRRIARRMTYDDVTLPPSSANGYAPNDLVDVPSRRTSWMKRFSAISNSQHSSRNTSPAPPLTPSVTCSNGSMAFSRDGSTVPVVGRRTPSLMAPNKLVKRSSSVRTSHEAPVQSSGLRPSFRRPATSHARSITLQNQTAMLEMTAEAPSVDELPTASSTDSEVEYAHFFTARVAKGRTLAKRSGFSAGAKSFRRIFADEKHKPVLVLARSVSSGAVDMDESMSEDGESTFFASRPDTPLSMGTNMVTTMAEPSSRIESLPAADISYDAAVRPRRSFSVTDILYSVTNAKKQRTAARLSRQATQRARSAPLVLTMGRRRRNSTSNAEHAGPSDLSTGLMLVGARREIATSSGIADARFARSNGGPLRFGASTSSPHPVPDNSGLACAPQLTGSEPAVFSTNQTPPSPTLVAGSAVHPSRFSMAPSEQASTLVDSSDNDLRALGSCDEDDADYQSETVYDSIRTGGATRSTSGATRSTSGGARGPRIETIFDESPPSKAKAAALRDLLPPGACGGYETNGASGQQSISEEEDSISTPVRTIRPERSSQDTPSAPHTHGVPLFPKLIPSSPPDMPKPLSLGTLEWDSRAGDDDNSTSHLVTPVSPQPQLARSLASGTSPKPSTIYRLASDLGDKDARSSIFDWSEQQPADKNSGSHTPPRPRTVHGKKDANRRASRSASRRVPSGLHARSQSVPVVPDVAGKRSAVVTNKFGTWGVGSKGVTEDWNDDFDFSDLHEDPVPESLSGSQRIDSGTVMVVPKSIQEQQNNVLANIGLLREWGLLIEELKEHRIRAVALAIVEGPLAGMWEEVDAMIDLADQEAGHEDVSRLSPPSSVGFEDDPFEDGPGTSPSLTRALRKSRSPNMDFGRNSPSVRPRRSILPSDHDIFSPQPSPIPPKPRYNVPATPPDHKPIITRPRKDSEAKARSVIEALQQRKSVYDPLGDAPPTPSSKKVPFDTATLRRIVPYVATLTYKVKDAIRDAEGLYSSPSTSPMHENPPFSNLFHRDADVAADVAAQLKLMTVM